MFIVVSKSSYNDDEGIYKIFKTLEKARKILQEDWEDWLNNDFAENNFVDMEESYHEDDYAVVQYDHDNKREWILIKVDYIEEVE